VLDDQLSLDGKRTQIGEDPAQPVAVLAEWLALPKDRPVTVL